MSSALSDANHSACASQSKVEQLLLASKQQARMINSQAVKIKALENERRKSILSSRWLRSGDVARKATWSVDTDLLCLRIKNTKLSKAQHEAKQLVAAKNDELRKLRANCAKLKVLQAANTKRLKKDLRKKLGAAQAQARGLKGINRKRVVKRNLAIADLRVGVHNAEEALYNKEVNIAELSAKLNLKEQASYLTCNVFLLV